MVRLLCGSLLSGRLLPGSLLPGRVLSGSVSSGGLFFVRHVPHRHEKIIQSEHILMYYLSTQSRTIQLFAEKNIKAVSKLIYRHFICQQRHQVRNNNYFGGFRNISTGAGTIMMIFRALYFRQ